MKTQPQTIPKKKSRKKLFFSILLVSSLLLAGAGYTATRIMTGPAVGTIVQTMPMATRPERIELKQFDGTHISFALPVTYIEQTVRRQPNPSELESRTFVSSGMASKVLTIIVSKLPSGKLEDDASYLMRTQDKTKYLLQEIVVKNEKVSIFTNADTQQMQQTAFWVHQGKLLSFTLAGTAVDTEATKAEYRSMVETIGWR